MKLEAKIREKGGLNQLRNSGLVPGVVYGRGVENVNVAVSRTVLDKALKEAGESTLLELVLEDGLSTAVGAGQTKHVLIHDIQRDPIKDFPIHVDFLEVRLDQKIRAEVPLVFTGEAPAIKELGGVLVKNVQHVEVEALPQDLPHNIEVDISLLKTFEDRVAVADIAISPKVKLLAHVQTTIALVVPPRSAAELEEIRGEVVEDISRVEGVVKEKALAAEVEAVHQKEGENK